MRLLKTLGLVLMLALTSSLGAAEESNDEPELETKYQKATYIYNRALAKMSREEREDAVLMYISPKSSFKATYKHMADVFQSQTMGNRDLSRVVVIGGPDADYTRKVVKRAFKYVKRDLSDMVIVYVGDGDDEAVTEILSQRQPELRFQTLGKLL